MASTRTVLVLSNDPLAAALLGLLAERSGFTPAFGGSQERPEDAVARVKPLFVVLLDASHPAARSDLFFRRAARRRVGLAVLTHPRDEQPPAGWALDRDVPCLDVPTTPDQFARVIEAASASNWWRSGRDRRSVPRTLPGDDGGLVYVDRTGARWQVYDRRSGSDRRVFVNDAGAAWACVIRDSGGDGVSPTELERQLARATRLPAEQRS